MRPVKAWGLICSDKRLVDLAFSTRARAKTSKLNCDKVVRVEIRELPARKKESEMKPIDVERFWAKVNKTDTCWLWTGAMVPQGYGQAGADGKTWRAHRLAWLITHGELPPKPLVFDHVCRIRNCVNPSHLEAVSTRENVLRGVGHTAQNARKTHCKNGHEYTAENTRLYGPHHYRCCRSCEREKWYRDPRRRAK